MSLYTSIIRPVLFRINPEVVHDSFIFFGKIAGFCPVSKKLLKMLFSYSNPRLKVAIKGINFRNPVGLAAGFDKNAQIIDTIGAVGFGFTEVGSITNLPCKGNPKPRLWRIPKDKGLTVYYGLANKGSRNISKKLLRKRCSIPVGINIAKTNDSSIFGDASVTDYLDSFQMLKSLGEYIVINISCPNTGDGCTFQDPVFLEKLLKQLPKVKKPVFLKVSPDLEKSNYDIIIALAFKYNISGLVISNLRHSHTGLKTAKKNLSKTKGGISGIPTKHLSEEVISYVYKKSKGKLVIIGVGGIFSAEDAYQKIRNGASLVQLITGMIYEGPGLIKKINKGLVKFLDRDGFKNISEAVGANHR